MRTVLALAIALALLAGCSKPEAKYVGKWTGKVEVPAASMEKIKAQLGPMAANIEEELAKLSMSLELKADGSYTMNTTAPGSENVSGKWTLDSENRTVTLGKPEFTEDIKKKMKENGMTDDMIKEAEAASEQQVFKIAEGDKSMSMSQSQMGIDSSLTFTKN